MTKIRERILKATKGRFTPRQVSARIRRYLRRETCCPWVGPRLRDDCKNYGGEICKAALPKLPMSPALDKMRRCPCHAYRRTYINKRAKEALK